MKRARILIGLVVLILSCSLLLWAAWPTTHVTRTLDLSPAELALPTAE